MTDQPQSEPTASKRTVSQAFALDSQERANKRPSFGVPGFESSTRQFTSHEVKSASPSGEDFSNSTKSEVQDNDRDLVKIEYQPAKTITLSMDEYGGIMARDRDQRDQIRGLRGEIDQLKKESSVIQTLREDRDGLKERLRVANDRCFEATKALKVVKCILEPSTITQD